MKVSLPQAVAAPFIYMLEGRALILHPLSIKEICFVENTFKEKDDVIKIEGMLYIIWRSMLKEDGNIKRGLVNKLLGKNIKEINKIAELILFNSSSNEEKGKQGSVTNDYTSLMKFFSETYGWSAKIVGDLTPLQLFMYLKPKAQGTPVNSIREARKLLRDRKGT